MLTVDEVLTRIAKIVPPVSISRLPLDTALNQILAEPVTMAEDSPPFDRATLDGYAVRAADVKTSPAQHLHLIGHIDAGSAASIGPLAPGQCMAINTGAPVPPGADAVLMVEHTQKSHTSDGQLRILPQKGVVPGYGIQRRAADAHAGDTVLSPGRRLRPADLAVAAAAGAALLPVRRIRAALLVTGDELVPSGVPTLNPGQIRNSNHPMLSALLQQYAAVSTLNGSLCDLGTASDNPAQLRSLLQKGLDESNLLLISGGMSMGTKDLIPPLLAELSVTFHTEKVRMKPGKPFLFGTWPNPRTSTPTIIAGLPGNPVSSFVTFQLFVRAIIAQLTGQPPAVPFIDAQTDTPLDPNDGDRDFYQPCTLRHETDAALAHPLMWKGSADLFTLAKAHALLLRPAHAPAADAHTRVKVLTL